MGRSGPGNRNPTPSAAMPRSKKGRGKTPTSAATPSAAPTTPIPPMQGIIQDTAKNYEEVSLIGSGAYGTVYKAKDLANEGQFVALKKLRVPLQEDGVPVSTLREIAVLKQIEAFEHPNIVRLLDICHGRKLEEERQLILYLVFEHVEQDLATFLEKCPSPGLGPDKIKDMTYQLLNGVDFLHSNRIVHRDLKPQNILITNSGQVKIADFGLARIFEQHMVLTSVVVTLWYRSPEVLLQSSYATAVDVWSAGCIFGELFRRKPLFRGQHEVDQLRKIFEVTGSPLEAEWPDVSIPWSSFKNYKPVPLDTVIPELCSDGKELLEKMFVFNPKKRISARDCLNQNYFKELKMHPPRYMRKTPKRSSVSVGTQPGTSKSK